MSDSNKFKLWNIAEKRWGDREKDGLIYLSQEGKVINHQFTPSMGQIFVDVTYEWQIFRCTGLKDKNGTLIYEGDIVQYDDFSNGAFISLCGEDIQPKTRSIIRIDNLFKGEE